MYVDFLFLFIETYTVICNTLNQKSKSPSNNFSNISKSILPILIIQTVMDREFSYAKN